MAAQSAHTKHIEVAPASPSISAPMSHLSRVTPRRWAWHSRYSTFAFFTIADSIIGVRKVATSAKCESMWCSWQVVSYFVEQTFLVPKCDQPLECCNWRSSIFAHVWSNCSGWVLREAVSHLNDAFNKAFIEKTNPLSLCPEPSDTSQHGCKAFLATSSSETCRRQPARPIAKRVGKQILRVRNLGQGRSIPNTLQMVILFALITTLVAVP